MTDDVKRDWLALPDDPPGIGHNSQAADLDIGERQRNADVAALFAMYRRVVGNISRAYLARTDPIKDDLQLAAVETLGATMHMFSCLGATGEEVAIIQKIMTSIKEVGAGRRVSWLEPSGKRGRTPGIPEEVAVLRAGYAAAMEVLNRRGLTSTNAAHLIARKIKGDSPAFAGKKTNRPHWKAVRDWRYELANVAPGDDLGAADLYQKLVRRFEEQPHAMEAFLESRHESFLSDPADY